MPLKAAEIGGPRGHRHVQRTECDWTTSSLYSYNYERVKSLICLISFFTLGVWRSADWYGVDHEQSKSRKCAENEQQ